jgi:hypothetical protein
VRLGAVIALALAAGVVSWLVLRDGGNTSSSPPAQPSGAAAASVAQIQSLAASVGHPVFWLGPKSGFTYELTETSSGKIYIRYLPSGVKVGASKPYLTVATYPFPGAYPAIARAAASKGAVSVKLTHGGLAVLDGAYPESVQLAYPGVDYQVEVYDPVPRRAMRMVSAGRLLFFGRLTAGPPAPPAGKPVGASLADLESLVSSIGHPIYWAGPKAGYTYELTQTSNGNVYVRYLPRGVKVGAAKEYLTVVTYPFPHALNALRQTLKANEGGVTKLTGGGLAVVDKSYPQSVHLAYPGAAYQVEVFDPSPAHARQVATSGDVQPVH